MILSPVKKTLTALFLLLFPLPVFPQYNLTKFNGLPSDHVYMFLRDRHGYLWIATDKGVLRYNGYEFKTFNTSQELGGSDVWRLYRDRKDRIWLFGFSHSFGYIYNNKYHKVVESDEVVSPGSFVHETEDELLIPTNKVALPGARADSTYILYRELYRAKTPGTPVYVERNQGRHSVVLLGDSASIFTRKKECFHPPGLLPANHYGTRTARYRNHVFFFTRRQNRLVYLNTDSCTFRVMQDNPQTPPDFSYLQQPENRETDPRDYVYVYYRHQVDKLDSLLRRLQTFTVTGLTRSGISGYDLVYILEDSLWGRCVATETNGGFITVPAPDLFKKGAPWDSRGFTFLGPASDSTGYWWNEQSRTLTLIGNGKPMSVTIPFGQLPSVNKVLRYNHRFDLLLLYNYYHLMDRRTGKLGPRQRVHNDTSGLLWRTAYHRLRYMLSNRELYVYAFNAGGTFGRRLLKGKFTEVVSDPTRRGHWVYNQHTLFFISSRNTCIPMKSLLKKLGINQLEQFAVDRSGALLLLGPDKLIRYDAATRHIRELLPNCNLAGTRLALNRHTLVAAGRYGVAFMRIDSSGVCSAPLLYHNIKNNHYSFVSALQLLAQEVLLKTDAGFYTLPLPADSAFDRSSELPALLLVQHNDSTYTGPLYRIGLAHQRNVLQFDLVRPAGNGTLGYRYRIEGLDSAWKELNANELVLPELKAGKYYTLSVIARDAVWQSDVIHVQLYVTPLWWQSGPGLYITWLAVMLAAAGILFLTALTTHRFINKRNARHRQLLEMELKAVYAQINPHFIFNTLNSGLHFIRRQKTDEAYNHILRFSQLLRAYLKASRNRYITLAEEITNLRNYIELQQTRFGGIFEYRITLHNIGRPEAVSIPSLLLQPIVENAIEHGLRPKEGPGQLEISFALDAQKRQLTCTVSDNGIGRARSKATRSQSDAKKESYGNELVKELTDLFNRYEQTGIEIGYLDLPEPRTGTIVRITINNLHLSYAHE